MNCNVGHEAVEAWEFKGSIQSLKVEAGERMVRGETDDSSNIDRAEEKREKDDGV